MKPIRSFRAICRDYGLNLSQVNTLQSLVDQCKGVLHPYWIQLALYVPYSFARRLHDELIMNEWAIPDEVEIDGNIHESKLTNNEIEILAQIEISISSCFASH